MVDLHTHVLPEIDDGSQSIDETIRMLQLMQKDGIEICVATPHFDLSQDDSEAFVKKRTQSLLEVREVIKSLGMTIDIRSGCELMFTPQLASVNLDNYVIEGTDYVLIELSTRYDDPSVLQTFEIIIGHGYIPILAHVERYNYLIEDSQRIIDLINKGVIIQVNAKSLNSEKFPFVNALFKQNLAHVIGSDSHNMTNRMPNIKRNIISDQILQNSYSVINNELLDIHEPKKLRKLFSKYF